LASTMETLTDARGARCSALASTVGAQKEIMTHGARHARGGWGSAWVGALGWLARRWPVRFRALRDWMLFTSSKRWAACTVEGKEETKRRKTRIDADCPWFPAGMIVPSTTSASWDGGMRHWRSANHSSDWLRRMELELLSEAALYLTLVGLGFFSGPDEGTFVVGRVGEGSYRCAEQALGACDAEQAMGTCDPCSGQDALVLFIPSCLPGLRSGLGRWERGRGVAVMR